MPPEDRIPSRETISSERKKDLEKLFVRVEKTEELLSSQTFAVTRLELAIAGDPRMGQDGIVLKHTKLEEEVEALKRSVKNLENWKMQVAFFCSGIAAVITIILKLIDLYAKK